MLAMRLPGMMRGAGASAARSGPAASRRAVNTARSFFINGKLNTGCPARQARFLTPRKNDIFPVANG
jgi:hypothetical protein